MSGKLMVLVLGIWASHASMLAQPGDSVRVVIISPRVGPGIDRAERARYGIFVAYPDFDSAFVFQQADSQFCVWLRRANAFGVTRDTVIVYPLRSLQVTAERINHYEELEEGKYSMGTDPPVFRFTDGGIARPTTRNTLDIPYVNRAWAGPADTLPHVFLHDRTSLWFSPVLYGGVGISTYGPNFDGVQRILATAEDEYAQQGHPVGHGRFTVQTSPLGWVFLGVEFTEEVRLTVSGGWSFDENSRVYLASMALSYLPPPLRFRSVRSFVTLGAAAFSGSISARYGAPIGYGTLDGIELKFRKSGGYLGAGVDWQWTSAAALVAEADYFLVAPAKDVRYPASLNFSGFSAAVKIVFDFIGGPTP